MIRMSHPDHGFMHATDKSDVTRLKGYGWTVVEEAPKVVPVTPTLSVPRKPGRPVGS